MYVVDKSQDIKFQKMILYSLCSSKWMRICMKLIQYNRHLACPVAIDDQVLLHVFTAVHRLKGINDYLIYTRTHSKKLEDNLNMGLSNWWSINLKTLNLTKSENIYLCTQRTIRVTFLSQMCSTVTDETQKLTKIVFQIATATPDMQHSMILYIFKQKVIRWWNEMTLLNIEITTFCVGNLLLKSWHLDCMFSNLFRQNTD